MRCYHFGNMYLSSIQQGIQAAHAQMELFIKYNPGKQKTLSKDPNDVLFYNAVKTLYEWATVDKTMICLNGGDNKELLAIEKFLQNELNPYPWATFTESTESLGGLLTNIAIILPEKIYAMPTFDTDSPSDWFAASMQHLTRFEVELINMKNKYRLAK